MGVGDLIVEGFTGSLDPGGTKNNFFPGICMVWSKFG